MSSAAPGEPQQPEPSGKTFHFLQGEGAGRIRVTLGWTFSALFFFLVRSN